jgi:hypothetical protein
MTFVATQNWYESSNFRETARLSKAVVNLSSKCSSTVRLLSIYGLSAHLEQPGRKQC